MPFKASPWLALVWLLCLGVWVSYLGVCPSMVNCGSPEDYDTNSATAFSKRTRCVCRVMVDYFQDKITKDEVLGVRILYFLNAPNPTLRPLPTATFPATRLPIPTPTAYANAHSNSPSPGTYPNASGRADLTPTFEEIDPELLQLPRPTPVL